MKEIRIDRPGARLLVEYHAQAVAQPDIDGFVAGLVQMIDDGSSFRAGQTFRMGWSTLRFVPADGDAGGTGRLAFEELDGSGVAGQWTRGISRTLIATRLQRSVGESFALPADLADFPSLAQTSIICCDLDPDGDLFLHRLEPLNDNDSGWFFSCTSIGHDHDDPAVLLNDSLYTHACRIQAVLPFLALPIGTRVLLAADGMVIEAFAADGTELAVRPGSYLAQRRGRTSRV